MEHLKPKKKMGRPFGAKGMTVPMRRRLERHEEEKRKRNLGLNETRMRKRYTEYLVGEKLATAVLDPTGTVVLYPVGMVIDADMIAILPLQVIAMFEIEDVAKLRILEEKMARYWETRTKLLTPPKNKWERVGL